MPYFLGNYEEGTKARVGLTYRQEPPQSVLDNYEDELMVGGDRNVKSNY